MYKLQKIVLAGDACLNLLLLLDLTICLPLTFERLWVRQLPTMKENNSLPSLVSVRCASFDFSLAFPFVFCVIVPTIYFFDFLPPKSTKKFTHNRVIHKVRQTQHQNPEFRHTQGEIIKNLQKIKLAFKWGVGGRGVV